MRKAELAAAMDERDLDHDGLKVKDMQRRLDDWLESKYAGRDANGWNTIDCEVTSPYALSVKWDEALMSWFLFVSTNDTKDLQKLVCTSNGAVLEVTKELGILHESSHFITGVCATTDALYFADNKQMVPSTPSLRMETCQR